MNAVSEKTACVTGATSGIGAAFAELFARQGFSLILTGRREEKIRALADRLSVEHGVSVEVIQAELSDRKTIESLALRLAALDGLEILVNNAGFAEKGRFFEQEFPLSERMLQVHDLAVLRLTHAVLPDMMARRRGAVINVSSISAFLPFPKSAVYSASKSFLNVFTESLHYELRGTGVRVQALCPGMTRTDFHERMGFDPGRVYKDRGLMKAMTPEAVADASLACLKKNRVICFPGVNNRLLVFLIRRMPRGLLVRMTRSRMRHR